VVPTEIVLNIMPKGGYDDWRAFLHELGHALHFGYTDPDLEFEYKYLGDNSVTEGYAMFLDHLVLDRTWLSVFLDPENLDDLLRFINLKRLYMVRRYGAKLEYELTLHDGTPLDGKERVYTETLDRALKVPHPAENFLSDLDLSFYCARYLRAWILQAQIHGFMRREFGPDWHRRNAAGAKLVELFRLGQKYDADEIARTIGYGGVDIAPLLSDVRANLG
jgi:hypothetical protein